MISCCLSPSHILAMSVWLLLWLYLCDGSFFLLSPYAHLGDILLHFLRRGDKQSLLQMKIGKEVDGKFG
jgi:hypothetical protein